MKTIKPSTPFSNGMSYEFFLESFCYRCNKHKENSFGFCAYTKDGGCPVENAMEDARFDIDKFPADKIVCVEAGETVHWNVCTEFDSDDAEVMKNYKALFAEEDEK